MGEIQRFADPYKRCRTCKAWVDAVEYVLGPIKVLPCGHRAGYDDVCPSWSPVSGCHCEPKGHGRDFIPVTKVR